MEDAVMGGVVVRSMSLEVREPVLDERLGHLV